MPLTLSDGTALHWRSRGSGPTVVALHGLGGSSETFDALATALAPTHRVVTIDLRGHGGSPAGSAPATVRRLAADVAECLAALDARDVTLVGWSLGGVVAAQHVLSYDRPGRVGALVLVECSPRFLAEPGWDGAAFGGLDGAAALAFGSDLVDDHGAWARALATASLAGGRAAPIELDRHTAAAESADLATLLSLWVSVAGLDWRGDASRIAVPTVCVRGARSQVFPGRALPWLAATIPGARLVELPEAGHAPHLDEPDAVARCVARSEAAAGEARA